MGREFDGVLRGEPNGDHPASCPKLGNPASQQVGRHRSRIGGLQRLGVKFALAQFRYAVRSVLVTCPQAFPVQYGETAEATDERGGFGRDHGVGGSGYERQVERVGIYLPGRGHDRRSTGAPGGYQGNLVKVVAATGAASQSDLYGIWHSALVFTTSPDAWSGIRVEPTGAISGRSNWAPRRSSGCHADGIPSARPQ